MLYAHHKSTVDDHYFRDDNGPEGSCQKSQNIEGLRLALSGYGRSLSERKEVVCELLQSINQNPTPELSNIIVAYRLVMRAGEILCPPLSKDREWVNIVQNFDERSPLMNEQQALRWAERIINVSLKKRISDHLRQEEVPIETANGTTDSLRSIAIGRVCSSPPKSHH